MQLPPKLIDTIIAQLKFPESGLLPVIAQQHDSGEVLMLAWANEEAIRLSLSKGEAVYWSRSRNQIWHKGATSGHVQKLVDFRFDCDADAILYRVNQTGPACHTNRRSCFYLAPRGEEVVSILEVE